MFHVGLYAFVHAFYLAIEFFWGGGLFSYGFGYLCSRSMDSPSFESPMFYCKFYLSVFLVYYFLFLIASELTISAS